VLAGTDVTLKLWLYLVAAVPLVGASVAVARRA